MASGLECQRESGVLVPSQQLDGPTGRRIPETDRAVLACGGNDLAVGAVFHAGNGPGPGRRCCVVHGDQVVMTLSFQIAPLPSAERRRTIIEEALDPIDVVGRPLAFRQRHAVEIEETLGSLSLLVCGMACGIGGPELVLQPQVVAIADGQAKERQQGHDPHQPQGCFSGPSMRRRRTRRQRLIGRARTGSPSRK